MNNYKKILGLEKRLVELNLQLHKLEVEKAKLFANLEDLNKQYLDGILNYTEYSALWNLYLNYGTEDDWVTYYNERAEHILKDIAQCKAELKLAREAREKIKTTTVASLTLVTLLLIIGGLSIVSQEGIGGIARITGFVAASEVTISQVNITVYYSIARSDNLANGIGFGTVSSGVIDVNATDNYNGADSGTTLYMAISSDSNVNLDFCTKAEGDLVSGANSFEEGNISWADASSTDISTPALASATQYTMSYALGTTNLAPGSNNYYRFWLTVPSDVPPGTYTNNLTFKAVQTGTGC